MIKASNLKNNRVFKKKDIVFIFVLLVYFLAGLLLIGYYKYQINPDGISYISIAKAYLGGDFGRAINGYWSPLISWLLLPFLKLKVDPLLATKILSLIVGFFTLIGARLLLNRFKILEYIKSIILFLLIPNILYLGFSIATPDLLSVCLLVYYFYIIFDPSYYIKLHKVVLCGFLGVLLYLSKGYNFYFFILSFFLINSIYLFDKKERRLDIIKKSVLGFLIFFVISSVWITLISKKYQQVTVGTTGKYNYAIVSLNANSHPIHYQGFLDPPNDKAISSWEDPTYLEVDMWSPLGSVQNFRRQLKILEYNFKETLLIYNQYNYFLPTILMIFLGYVLLSIAQIKAPTIKYEIIMPSLMVVLYLSGFLLIAVIDRHIFISIVLIMLMGGYLLTKAFESSFFTRTRKIVLLGIFIISFSVFSIQFLKTNRDVGKNIYNLANTLRSNYNIQGNVGSNNGSWHNTLYLSYYLGLRYYGESEKGIEEQSLRNELVEHNIDYYFVWGNIDYNNKFLSPYKEITNNKLQGLKIYNIKEIK